VILISLASLIGLSTLSLSERRLKKIVLYLVSFSAGSLFGDAFFHLLPEASSKSGFTLSVSLSLIGGIAFSFIVEKVIHWRHCHLPITRHHIHPLALMNLFGDAVHNFIDGMIIAASFLASVPIGIATAVAVFFHEVPQEIGDFGVLMHGGFSRMKALSYNFVTALTALVGAAVAFVLSGYIDNLNHFILPFAAGTFIYIAGSDLIPELHREVEAHKSLLQFFAFAAGVGIMLALLVFG